MGTTTIKHITHGYSQQHIWTYEVRNIDANCDCNSVADTFTGSFNFYCESSIMD